MSRKRIHFGAVDVATCIGLACLRLHGVRLATWRGVGPSSIYIVCDECHQERLTAEERKHMVPIAGAVWVRKLGLHKLHLGRPSGEQTLQEPAGDVSTFATAYVHAWEHQQAAIARITAINEGPPGNMERRTAEEEFDRAAVDLAAAHQGMVDAVHAAKETHGAAGPDQVG